MVNGESDRVRLMYVKTFFLCLKTMKWLTNTKEIVSNACYTLAKITFLWNQAMLEKKRLG